MKKYFVFHTVAILIVGLSLLPSCENKTFPSREFMVKETYPASALTIGWYLPVNLLTELVGENFTPRVVKDENLGSIMLFIVTAEEHYLDGEPMGKMEAAHLIVPIVSPDDLNIPDRQAVDAAMVCPINIVEQSERLGDKFDAFDFATYSGDIDLKVDKPGEKYMVIASVQTANGKIEINGMFEEEETTLEVRSAMMSNRPAIPAYFYGEEKTNRIINGKGNLKTEGNNIIDAMQLGRQPFFLRLDLDMSWSFDFVNENTGKETGDLSLRE
jgi:hypothetical protein